MDRTSECYAWHLASDGWHAGTSDTGFEHTELPVPPDRALTRVLRVYQEGDEPERRWIDQTFHCGDEELVSALLAQFGQGPGEPSET